jgi:translocation protein SEC62
MLRLYILTSYPVGFWDSFKPVWVWDEKKKPKKKSKSSSGGGGSGSSMGPIQVPGQPPPASATTGSAAPQMTTSAPSQRNLTPRVEEVFDE